MRRCWPLRFWEQSTRRFAKRCGSSGRIRQREFWRRPIRWSRCPAALPLKRKRGKGVTIGILGGGQLGYMLALAGYPLGLHFRFLDPSPEAPVGRIAHRVTAEFNDEQALE